MIAPRTPAEISGDIASLLPDGWAWDHAPTSNMRRSFAPLEGSVADFEGAAFAQLFESEPDTCEQMLDRYEQVLGPDPCMGDPQTLTFTERRTSVTARWIASYGASVAELIALAASYGATVSITEFRRRPSGVLKSRQNIICNPEQFTAVVTMPPAQVVPFRAGASRSGDPIGRIERSAVIECVLRRAAPSRVTLVFNYLGTIVARWNLPTGGAVWS